MKHAMKHLFPILSLCLMAMVGFSGVGHAQLAQQGSKLVGTGAAWVYATADVLPPGPISSYDFSGDLLDGTGSNHGADSGTVSFDSGSGRTWVSLGADGRVTFPGSLTSGIFSPGSMAVDFSFRLGDTDPTILMGTGPLGVNAIWQDAGIILLVQGGELTLTFNDGIDLDAYAWETIQTGLVTGQWYAVRVSFNLNTGYWNVLVDGAATTGAIPGPMDTDTLASAVETNTMTLGGKGGAKINPYTGDVDIDSLRVFSPAPSEIPAVIAAFLDLKDHIEATTPLTEGEQETRFETIRDNLETVEYDSVSSALFAFTGAYEAAHPPLYQDGITHLFDDLPVLGRTLQFTQEYVLQSRFTPDHVDGMGGVVFEHAEVIPGVVDSSTTRVSSAVVEVNGTYDSDTAAELTDQSRVVRPTGHYLAAGDLVTVHAPGGVTGQGLSIVVGAHFRDMDYDDIGAINRFPDISTEFPLDSTTITVGNPLGGGIYLKVPDGAAAGWFNLTIENAVMSPYFSWRQGRETDVSAWLLQVAGTGAPWADFESDKFMFTIPLVNLAGVTHPDSIMMRWDAIMDAISDVGGRPRQRPRAEYYTFDTRLVTPAYGAGYPMVIPFVELNYFEAGWNPLEVLIRPPYGTMFHEMGHNHLHPTLSYGPTFDECHEIEAETIVHTLEFSVLHNVYGASTEQAFLDSYSYDDLGFSFEEAAFDWIVTTNFRNNLPMDYDLSAPMADKDMLKYQPRGWAKYGDIARWIGWDVLDSTNGAFYHAGVPQSGTACPEKPFIVTRDEYIEAASAAAGVNMAPLFHFWGVPPSAALAETLAAHYPPSVEILQMILHYRDVVAPKTFDDYNAYHTAMYDRLGYQQPRYDEYIVQFDSTFAQEIRDQFDMLITTYGLDTLAINREFGVKEKWNIVSVPLTMSDYSRTNLFPGSTTTAYSFEGGYVAHDTLENGRGYWIKFSTGQTISQNGLERVGDTIAVEEGWNMVGSLSNPIAASGVGSIPGGIVTSPFYRYDDGYSATDTLEPGVGYWVKVSQTGQLVTSASEAVPANRIRIEDTGELPPPPPEEATSVAGETLPSAYALEQNYPNPFNPVTTIRYALPVPGWVKISVFNVLGQEVAVLSDGVQEAGFRAISFDAGNLPSGMYTYRITAGSFNDARKMLVLK